MPEARPWGDDAPAISEQPWPALPEETLDAIQSGIFRNGRRPPAETLSPHGPTSEPEPSAPITAAPTPDADTPFGPARELEAPFGSAREPAPVFGSARELSAGSFPSASRASHPQAGGEGRIEPRLDDAAPAPPDSVEPMINPLDDIREEPADRSPDSLVSPTAIHAPAARAPTATSADVAIAAGAPLRNESADSRRAEPAPKRPAIGGWVLTLVILVVLLAGAALLAYIMTTGPQDLTDRTEATELIERALGWLKRRGLLP